MEHEVKFRAEHTEALSAAQRLEMSCTQLEGTVESSESVQARQMELLKHAHWEHKLIRANLKLNTQANVELSTKADVENIPPTKLHQTLGMLKTNGIECNRNHM